MSSNPFVKYNTGADGSGSRPVPAYNQYNQYNHYDQYEEVDETFENNYQQQSSIYTPEGVAHAPAAKPTIDPEKKGKARTTVLRKGAGQVWEDPTLLEWDPKHFRLFIGDLDPAVSDDAFKRAFSTGFPSFVKAKVIRDKVTRKGKGFGFVSYSDPEDFLKAWKEMNGKYVGGRPVKISKSQVGVQQVAIGDRKAKALDAKNRPKTGTKPYERANKTHNPIASNNGGGVGPNRKKSHYIRR